MRKLIYTIPVLVLAACGGSAPEPAGMPTTALPIAEVERLEHDVAEFAAQHIQAWPDVDAYIDELSADAGFADPTWGDQISGRDAIARMWRQWEGLTDYEIDVTATYLSASGAAFEETWPGLQPPMALPPDPPVASGLTVYTFDDGKIAQSDLWYLAADNEAYGIGCFVDGGCPAFTDTVDRYLSAWGSRDADLVAALYSADAAFADSLLGLEARGAGAISDLADVRFGSIGEITIEALDLYAWTDGQLPPAEYDPERGGLIGVAIHYLVTARDEGTTEMQEGLATLVLGTRSSAGIEADPQGLIHREEVYHAPESLGVASTFVPAVDDPDVATTGTIEITIQDWAGVEGYRLLAVAFGEDELAGGAFWTIIDSDPFSGSDVVHPPNDGDGESNAEAWGDDDYVWNETAMLEPGTYSLTFAANPGELAPYGSHLPAAGYELGCMASVDVVAGEVTELVVSGVLVIGNHAPCPLVTVE